MTPDSTQGIGKTFKEIIISFLTVTGDLARKSPAIVAIFFLILFVGIYSVSDQKEPAKLVISILIGIFSIGIYIKNKSFSETILTLFLGLLTVFSIQWDQTNTLIFSGVLCSFIVVYFLINAIRIAAEIETILIQAASFISVKECTYYLKKLQEISKDQTQYKQIDIIDRAKITRFLVFTKMPLTEIKEAITLIEMIKVIYQFSLEDAMDYYYSLNQFSMKSNNRYVTLLDIEQIHSKINDLPIIPSEFTKIFKETKLLLITKKMSINQYFTNLYAIIENGYSMDRIINEMNK